MDVNFAASGPADENILIALMREFYAVEHLAFDEAVTRVALRQMLRDDALGAVYSIRSGEDVAGYVVLTFGFSLEFHGRDALVDELYLREEFRGKGLGRAVLEFVEGVCRAEGIKAVHLEVDRVNTRAQEVYRAAGYRDHDRYLLTKWVDVDSRE